MLNKLLFLVVTLPFVAQASGRFNCYDKDKSVSVYAVTGRTPGSPIYEPLKVTAGKVQFEVDRDHIAQYKQNMKSLYVLGLSDDFQYKAVELETYLNLKEVLSGKLTVQYIDKIDGGVKKVEASVTCDVE